MKRVGLLTVLVLSAGVARAQEPGTAPTGAEPTAEELLQREMLRNYVERLDQQQNLMLSRAAMQEEARVNIDVTQARLQDVLADFSRQANLTIQLDERHIDPEERVTFRVQDVPFRQALRAFIEMPGVDLYFVEDSPTLIRLARRVRVTYSFRGADVAAVVEIIAKTADANVIIHPSVRGPITLTVTDRPWDAVLEQVVTTAGFALVRENWDILRVVPREELLRQMDSELFQLQYLHPPSIYRGQIRANEYIFGAPFRAPASQADWISSFALLRIIQSAMTRDARGTLIGAIEYEPDSNTIVVRDTRPVLTRVHEIITALDREPTMVMIGVRFVTTTNQELFDFGVQWARTAFNDAGQYTAGDPGLTFGTFGVQPGTSPFDLAPAVADTSNAGSINRLPFGLGGHLAANWLSFYDVAALLRLYERDSLSRVQQEPYIATLNNMEATIFAGRQIRFAEQELSAATTTSPALATFREARNSPVDEGFQLMVIPNVIGDRDEMILTVIPQLSLLEEFQNFPSDDDISISLPQVARDVLVTRVLVSSGQTVVMGGLSNIRQTVTEDRIPFLSSIPLIGWAFKQRRLDDARTHLLILLTPVVVHGTTMTEERLRTMMTMRRDQEAGPIRDLRAQGSLDAMRRQMEQERAREMQELQRLRQPTPAPGAAPRN